MFWAKGPTNRDWGFIVRRHKNCGSSCMDAEQSDRSLFSVSELQIKLERKTESVLGFTNRFWKK